MIDNTHTDGASASEENVSVAAVAMARRYASLPPGKRPARTLALALCPGNLLKDNSQAADLSGEMISAVSDALVTYQVFGEVAARRGGSLLSLGGSQQRRLLAALLTQPNSVLSLDRLIDVMWDAPPAESRRTVMSYVSRLRSVLGPDAVLQSGGGYRLVVDELDIDGRRVEQLVDRVSASPPTEAIVLLDEALGYIAGPAFGEFAHEWWALAEAARLEELGLVARERRAEQLVAVGRCEDAFMSLDGVVTAHPLRASAVVARVRAAVALGREAEALRDIAEFRRRVADQAGLDVPRVIVDLEAEVFGGRTASPSSARGYRLGEKIGEGAHGTVYRSVQPTLGREVAIKVVREHLADDPAFVARFEVEAQLVSRLEHPHIVPLYDFWREPGGAYLVFRLINGGTVADDVRQRGRWDQRRVDTFVAEIGGALTLAHAASVVHGDIKPSNILLDADGRSYLGDFGLAVAEGRDVRSGSPPLSDPSPYRPPEASGGQPPSVAGDVFGLGAVLHELLVGRPPVVNADGTVAVGSLERSVDAVVRRAISADPLRRFRSIGEMVAAWQTSISGSAVVATAGVATVNPFVGMRPYVEADARWFCSRAAVVDSLVDRFQSHRLVMVVGASGSGKSSLLHAGLAPRLRAAGVAVASMVPGDAPLERLRAALDSIATGTAGRSAPELAASIHADGRRVVVMVDQLEEIWTSDAVDDAERFLETLLALVDDSAGAVTVVGAMRADFYDKALCSPLLASHMPTATMALPAMSAAELSTVIVEPAATVGVEFEPGLAARLLADVAGRAGGLPMLQFTLHELFERRSGGVIGIDAYESLGGVAGSLATRAEEAFGLLDAHQQAIARRLFLSVVRIGDESTAVGRRRRRRDLSRDTDVVIDRFVDLRLLATDVEPTTREPTVELAHEALIGSWPRLSSWIADDRDSHVAAQRLEAAAVEWDSTGRSEGDLYRGARLEIAQSLVALDWPTLTHTEREFLTASETVVQREHATERRSRRRLRRLLVATSVALVLAFVGGSVAMVQRRHADAKATAAEVASLVNLSRSLVGSKRDLAVLLALRASLVDPSAATDGALMTALYSEPSFLGELSPSRPLRSVDVSDNGGLLWGAPVDSTDGLVRIDVDDGSEVVVPLPGQDDRRLLIVEMLDDHHALVVFEPVGGEAQQVQLFDLDRGVAMATAPMTAVVSDLAVSPDASQVAITAATVDGEPGVVTVLTLPGLDPVASTTQPGDVELPPGASWYSTSVWVDNETLAIGSTSGRIALWRPATDEVVKHLNDPPGADVGQVGAVLAITADGQTLVAADLFPDGSHGSGVMAFDLTTGSPKWARPVRANPTFVLDDRNQRVIAQEAGPGSSRAFTYDLSTGERLETIYDTQHGTLCNMTVTADSRRLMMTSCNDASVGEWALDGATPAGPALSEPGWATGWNLWDFGTRVAMYDPGGQLHLRDLSTDALVPAPDGLNLDAWSWFLSDGRLMNVFPARDQVVVYDANLANPIRFAADIPDQPNAMAWSRDGSVLVVGAGDNDDIVVIDVPGQREKYRLHTGNRRSLGLDVTPDGSRLFAGSDSEVAAVFDLSTGERVGSLTGVANTTVSPDGTLVAGSSFDGTITFWSTRTFQRVGQPLSGSTSFSNSIQFTFDGRLLITSGLDNTQRIWDVAARRQIGPEIPVEEWTVAIAADSTRIAFNHADGVRLMDVDRDRLRAAACRVAGRELTQDEWRQYIGGTPAQMCASVAVTGLSLTSTPD
ncbi:MAG: protein kinase [Acidimicrobiaceae bacterium]|nr:protein kinase [Acidimicrobiaceae bacterium]